MGVNICVVLPWICVRCTAGGAGQIGHRSQLQTTECEFCTDSIFTESSALFAVLKVVHKYFCLAMGVHVCVYLLWTCVLRNIGFFCTEPCLCSLVISNLVTHVCLMITKDRQGWFVAINR